MDDRIQRLLDYMVSKQPSYEYKDYEPGIVRVYYKCLTPIGYDIETVMYINKSTGEIHCGSTTLYVGSVKDEFGGLEYIDNRGMIIYDKNGVNKRIKELRCDDV